MNNIQSKKNKKAKIILVGNKCDLINERKVSFQEGKKLADFFKVHFFETSVKTGKNIKELFYFLTLDIFVELSLAILSKWTNFLLLIIKI